MLELIKKGSTQNLEGREGVTFTASVLDQFTGDVRYVYGAFQKF